VLSRRGKRRRGERDSLIAFLERNNFFLLFSLCRSKLTLFSLSSMDGFRVVKVEEVKAVKEREKSKVNFFLFLSLDQIIHCIDVVITASGKQREKREIDSINFISF
jgi:hypothetical protein